MKIYTKFGDQGKTRVLQGDALGKHEPVIELIGALDELNSAIGMVISQNPKAKIRDQLVAVQNEIFEWGAVVAGAPASKSKSPGEDSVVRLEKEIDGWQTQLPKMTHFVLPGGSQAGATLHFVRTICRRTERVCSVVSADSEQSQLVPIQTYLNRLSDWLFVIARYENQVAGMEEVKWKPEARQS